MPRIKAIIFDMDDTLVSTSTIWRKAEEKFLKSLGYHYSEELAAAYKGMNSLDIGAFVYEKYKPEHLDKEQCSQAMRTCLLEEYENPVQEMPGVSNFLERVHGHFALSIASGSPLAAIEKSIQTLHWNNYLNDIISSEEVERGKPNPDVFLEMATRLKTPANEILVFEDSLHGEEAAIRAGMECFLIPSSEQIKKNCKSSYVFESFNAIQLKDIHLI
jgi:HAD superfamily hydrolase (TIGR01509 family)